MQDLDGIGFLAEIRRSPHFGSIPLIFISGTDHATFENLMKPYQYAAFVEKPVPLDRLVELMEENFVRPEVEKEAGKKVA
jgi:response regulator RpfG family c-di-GMP phosphodiesterase